MATCAGLQGATTRLKTTLKIPRLEGMSAIISRACTVYDMILFIGKGRSMSVSLEA